VKEHQELVRNVRRGDTIVTTGGIIGKVTKATDDPEIEVEIADGVRVKLVRGMISEVRTRGEPVKS
jgi:preprotein translocase subunit YajC